MCRRKIRVESFGLLRDVTDCACWAITASGEATAALLFIYGDGQPPAATFRLAGAPQRRAMAGLVLHATPQTGIYTFAGGEFASKKPQGAQLPELFWLADIAIRSTSTSVVWSKPKRWRCCRSKHYHISLF
jgi:hypothetical protein